MIRNEVVPHLTEVIYVADQMMHYLTYLLYHFGLYFSIFPGNFQRRFSLLKPCDFWSRVKTFVLIYDQVDLGDFQIVKNALSEESAKVFVLSLPQRVRRGIPFP